MWACSVRTQYVPFAVLELNPIASRELSPYMKANKGRLAASISLACLSFSVFASGCPDTERTQETSQGSTSVLTPDAPPPMPETPAQRALFRCEAFGDAFAESTTQLDATVAAYWNARDSIRERIEQQARLPEIESELAMAEDDNAEAYSANQSALAEFEEERGNELEAEVRLRYAERDVRNREATITTLEGLIEKTEPGTTPRLQLESRMAEARTMLSSAQSELREAEALSPAAKPTADRYQETERRVQTLRQTLSSLRQETDDQIWQAVERETSHLQDQISFLEQRVRLDQEQLVWAIREANALREPGGPICGWQSNRDGGAPFSIRG